MLTVFEQKVHLAFNTLTKTNNKVTTLDIKNYLRNNDPTGRYYQSEVSEAMMEVVKNVPTIQYNDTGKYREYFIPQTTNVITLSKKDAVSLLRKNTGKFFGITFIKKDGTQRTLNGHMSDKTFINDLGYLQIVTGKKQHKQVDPKKILEITINGNKYVVK